MILDESRRDGGVAPVAFPVLIADIGGTNVRFALLSDEHSALRSFPTIQTGDFSGFVEAVRATVLDTMSLMPQSLLIAIAGPLRDGILTLTNAHWEMDPPQIREALNLQSVITFNDFEALAMALPNLSEPQILKLGGGEPAGRRPRVVLGPGTGLGVAALVYSNRCYTPLPGEGGHMAFGPETARDYAIWPQLERVGGRVTAESILCGAGMARIYRAVAAADGVEGSAVRNGADVTERLATGDPIAEETVDLFFTYLGRFSGDLALLFMAHGGVFIGGGIIPRLQDTFLHGPFRAAFEDKAPHREILRDIPTYLVTEPRVEVTGLVTFAVMPERFAIDLTERRFDRQ